ncbi:DNA polymerase III, beta subunit [Clostridium collagenovorans DSM 3089]|uniref:Beta sliding clamp n=1 Tax=Clostridium collagenovorans DSM 3089 TaxID=1121306 RepID=A0A1M5YGI3_9CLOT|nr:DNA polymerase III subunit beta [Clostridium collagenovorans]SHI11181.1 DNA polymerase III, beta subunit [Clostridium collagenovorans DSM 3089]
MKFIVDKIKLQEAISNTQKAITGKSAMPVLQGICITATKSEITLVGSDLDLTIEARISADIFEEGRIVIDARLFGEIIKKMPNASIEIETIDDKSIYIKCLKSTATLVYMDPENYPSIPHINEDVVLTVQQDIIKHMIRGTIFAAAQDETRPILTGILFEVEEGKLNLVALDGYRVAIRRQLIDCNHNISAVIPSKTLSEVSKILEDSDKAVNITFTDNHILFNLGNTKVISRLLEGEFMKYSSIIPSEYNLKVIANRSDVLNAVERASLMGKEGNTNLIKLDIADDNLIISSNSQLGKAREEVSIILQGESLKIAFNAKYLIDIFKIIEAEEVVMEFNSSISPCVVKNKEDENECTYLLLPVRLVQN